MIMSILSKEELMELNYIMLGKGAPVEQFAKDGEIKKGCC